MPLTREERKLLHQKSKQPTFGSGKPDKTFGEEGDVAYRKVSDAGTVQYIKQDGDWVALSSSGDKPESRTQTVTRTIISGGGGGGVTNHGNLNGLSDDDHSQYVLVNGTRAFSGNWTNASHTIADLGTVTTADINGGNIDGMTIATSDITVGTGKTLDVSAGTLTLGANQISGDSINNGTIDSITIDQLAGPLDANSQAITNINIDSGAIDGVTIGANSANTGVFTTLTATTLGGALNVNNENLTNVDIDSGTIDNTDITVGTGKTLNVSAGTFTTSAAQNKVIIEGAASNLGIGNFNFTVGNTLQAGTVIADDLTAGRVVFSTGSGQLTDDGDFTFLNFNDSTVTPEHKDNILKRFKKIDWAAGQFSGANWWPSCYEYDDNKKLDIILNYKTRKIDHYKRMIKYLNVKKMLPIAGPPIFLQKDMAHLNYSDTNKSIFFDNWDVPEFNNLKEVYRIKFVAFKTLYALIYFNYLGLLLIFVSLFDL